MTTWRRGLTALLLLAAAVLFLPMQSAGAQTTAPGIEDNPANAGQVVQSWALFPAGSSDPSQPGNRPNFTFEAAPGSTIDDAITVANYGNVPLTLRLYASDAFNNADGGFDILRGADTPTDVGSWVKNPQPYITLEPGTQATVPVQFVVPIDATPGDHVGAFVASQETAGTGPDGKTITLDRRTGTRIYLRVTGEVSPDLSVENVSTNYTPKLNPFGGSATVTYRIVNRGNVRMKGTQTVEVGGPLGILSESATDDVPELLPGQSVDVTKTLDGVTATVISSTKVTVHPEEVVNATDNKPSTATGSALTLALPFTIMAVLLVLALVLYARHRYKKRNQPPSAPTRPSGAPQPLASAAGPTEPGSPFT